jgi:transmembrane sensor
MMEIPDHIKEIIERRFLNRESESDMVTLLQWRNESPEKEDEYNQLIALWADAGAVLDAPDFDSGKAWDKLQMRFKVFVPAGDTKLIPVLRPGYAFRRSLVAAVTIGIIIFAAWWVWHEKLPAPVTHLAEATTDNKTVSLPDGSIVSLRKGSTLRYPARFENNERVVILTGEAFFEVQHEATKPFRIQTTRSVVQVLGTSFLVNTTIGSDRVVVATGKVLLVNKKIPEQHCILSAKQEALFDGIDFRQQQSQGPNYLAWKTGKLKFSETTLDQVAGDLSGYYSVPVKLHHSLALKAGLYRITGEFDCRKQSLEQILDEIALFTGIRYKKQPDMIILFGPDK